ncbi:integrase core domain-containing protein [Streptomyces sp. NPDC057580]|uniref:integrase core domain-containing protein n=1 Tax=Streptomyces sp. NPDC057580 TaxID=3346173 RepID=UPI0036B4E114
MGQTGSCYDNGVAESFFGLLKAEIGTTVWESHEAARADVFRFIEIEYNRTRLRKHPVYGYVTPIETRALTTQEVTPRSVNTRCPRSRGIFTTVGSAQPGPGQRARCATSGTGLRSGPEHLRTAPWVRVPQGTAQSWSALRSLPRHRSLCTGS